MQRLVPGQTGTTEVEFSTALYPWPQAAIDKQRVWIRCNMVMSQDGAAVGTDGRSASIATPIDKQVFRAVRRDSDVILVGAGTARAEGYHPSIVPIALVTRSLVLPEDLPLFAQADDATPRTIVFTTATAIATAPTWLLEKADLIDCGTDEVDFTRVVEVLQERGLTRVHSEGGPGLLTTMIKARALDELLLTISPIIHGATSALVGELGEQVRGSFSQVLVDDGTLLLRFLPEYS